MGPVTKKTTRKPTAGGPKIERLRCYFPLVRRRYKLKISSRSAQQARTAADLIILLLIDNSSPRTRTTRRDRYTRPPAVSSPIELLLLLLLSYLLHSRRLRIKYRRPEPPGPAGGTQIIVKSYLCTPARATPTKRGPRDNSKTTPPERRRRFAQSDNNTVFGRENPRDRTPRVPLRKSPRTPTVLTYADSGFANLRADRSSE